MLRFVAVPTFQLDRRRYVYANYALNETYIRYTENMQGMTLCIISVPAHTLHTYVIIILQGLFLRSGFFKYRHLGKLCLTQVSSN
jgi:hypothetical protein